MRWKIVTACALQLYLIARADARPLERSDLVAFSHVDDAFGLLSLESGDPQTIAAYLYSRVQDLSTDATLELRVGSVRTLSRAEWEKEPWAAAITFPAPRQLDLTMRVHTGLENSIQAMPKWHARTSPPAREGGRIPSDLSIAALFSTLEERDSSWRDVRALSIVPVSGVFQGEAFDYRAVIFWYRGPTAEDATFSVLDHVIPAAANVLRWPNAQGESPNRALAEAAVGTCVAVPAPADFLNGRQSSLMGAAEHKGPGLSGHSASFRMGGQCAASSNCQSSCTPYIAEQECDDVGPTKVTVTHRAYSSGMVFSDSQTGAPSVCRASMGCAIESCYLGACHGISVSVSGGGVSFGGASPVWSWSATDVRICPAPPPAPPPPPKAPPIPPVQPRYPPGDATGGLHPGFCYFVSVETDQGTFYWLVCR